MTMKLMGEKEIKQWRRTRALGQKRFIVRKTITFALIPGVVTIVWYSLESLWTGRHEFNSIDYPKELFSFVVFGLWGFIESWFRWRSQEDQYRASAEPLN